MRFYHLGDVAITAIATLLSQGGDWADRIIFIGISSQRKEIKNLIEAQLASRQLCLST